MYQQILMHTPTHSLSLSLSLSLPPSLSQTLTHSQPGPSATVQDLGRSTITLEVDILNNGPTTIREGMVTIYLANRIADTKFTLYPTRLDVRTVLQSLVN